MSDWLRSGNCAFVLGLLLPFFCSSVSTAQSLMSVRVEQHRDVSAPLRDMIATAPQPSLALHEAEPVRQIPLPPGLVTLLEDPVRQRTAASVTVFAPVASLNFEGLGDGQYGFTVTGAPPDTEGTVGSTQYVQWVNTSFAVFNKTTGTLIAGPTAGKTLWSGFGGGCQNNNDGDPIVLYDKAAQRWIFSQFSVSTMPFLQCIAVSTTSDATGTYNRYSFQYNNLDDYPKMGVWSDAYYETFNMFGGTGNNTFVGADVCAYDRAAMLAGTAATQICFQQGTSVAGLLPSDIDGSTPPPAGSPNFMVDFGNNSLNLFKFHVDFTMPANSTFTGPTVIPVAAFNPVCGGGTCVPQPGTTQPLDSLADRLMYRLAYRNFGTHESLVVNHSVVAGSGGGVRWYEIQNPSGTPAVAQQSTFAPDSSYRWMGSIAMDKAGDMALGYSVSNGSSVFPSIAFTGRVATDPASTMEAEVGVVSGGGSQVGNSSGSAVTRWGDYSAMQIDPVDDCTFWYTQEYIKATGVFNWNTRIASFSFPNCTATATFPLTITAAGTGSGTVTSTPAGINCPGTCTANFASGTSVILTETPTTGSTFTGWSGACTGTGSCAVTMSAAQAVTATFTAPVTFPLSVTMAGSGSGTVTSTPIGINCPGTCSANFGSGASVTLAASAAAGSTFAGWSGACTGTGGCAVTMSAARAATATFNATVNFALTVTLAGTGSGTVTSTPTGISCPGTCSANFGSGASVTLSANAAANSIFTGWNGGGCTGTGNCTITMSMAQTVTATFVMNFALSVTLAGNGSGTVTSVPTGISCPGTCSASFASGTSVTLSPSAALGSLFAGWSGGGGCTGTGNCTVTMSMVQSVAGTFNLKTTTTTALTVSTPQANAGTTVTFTAKVSPTSGSATPTGTVAFSNGSAALGSASLSSGSATFTTSSLATGTYSVTAAYSGDANFATSSSVVGDLTVVDFTMTPGQSSLTVARGQMVQQNLTITPAPLANFNPTVTFACSGLPTESTCTFSPSSVTPNGAAAATTVSIHTMAPTAMLEWGSGRTGLFYAVFLPGFMGIVFLNRSKKKRRAGSARLLGLVCILMLSTAWWTACGGSSGGGSTSNPGTPVGSSAVTITATSSGTSPIAKQVTITLTVQ